MGDPADVADVNGKIDDHTAEVSVGFLGEKAVNVLELIPNLDRRD